MRVALLLLFAFMPGCVLTSAASLLSDPRYPPQEATIARVTSDDVTVLVRATDGSAQYERTLHFAVGGIDGATVSLEGRRTQAWSPFALFHDYQAEERAWGVRAVGLVGSEQQDLPIVEVPPSTGAKVASYALMPFCVLVDIATFPIEWLGLLIFMR